MTSEIKVNAIKKASGSTLTLGGCGTAVTLGSGATQSGFGRTGTVDWQTTKKTSTFTAANGEGYFVDTSGGVVTVNLPAGSAGSIVSVADYLGSFQTNACTIAANGSQKIGGETLDVTLSTEGQSVTLVYVDDTEGWITTSDSSENISGNAFIDASGGTKTTSGNDTIHTFTAPGNFVVSATGVCAANNVISYMIVAGGGGGGKCRAGGAGAGGFREVKSPSTPYTASPLDGYPTAPNRITVTAQSYPIVVGAGGAGTTQNTTASSNGSNSSGFGITSAGGGFGRNDNPAGQPPTSAAGSGGSGGGGANSQPGGSGNTPPTTPAQGTNGANALSGSAGSGGGGATVAGAQGPSPTNGGHGGAGATTEINGSSTSFAGGGGGGSGPGTKGNGGVGGGANGVQGGPGNTEAGLNGTANTGGGAGGNAEPGGTAGSGGSGIVIIRYKTTA